MQTADGDPNHVWGMQDAVGINVGSCLLESHRCSAASSCSGASAAAAVVVSGVAAVVAARRAKRVTVLGTVIGSSCQRLLVRGQL